MSVWQRVRERLRRQKDRYNLHVAVRFAIRASSGNPYFQALEQAARRAGCVGDFVVDAQGRLRPGTRHGLATKRATLHLDTYPNPAAIEGRTIADYPTPDGEPEQPSARRRPRVVIALDDDSELFLRLGPDGAQVEDPEPRFRR